MSNIVIGCRIANVRNCFAVKGVGIVEINLIHPLWCHYSHSISASVGMEIQMLGKTSFETIFLITEPVVVLYTSPW